MGKPRLIIIIRHAQSEGNKDKAIHQTVPDHRVSLTPEGHEQAREAGEKLRQLLRNDDTLHFFISPYRRTRETTEGILSTLCSNEPVPSPFQRSRIKVYEEPRLREQDFGNFQPNPAETERLWRERAEYGHFFYRIPNGESGADVYDRVSSFNGSLWRRFSEDSMASVAILVTHGLCSRVFLMAWYHYSVEFFEDLRNINHCEFLVMKLGKNGRYVLQNQLRRWSDLRRERAQRRSIAHSSPEIPVRRWGSSRSQQELAGVSLGDPAVPKRQNTLDLFKDDDEGDEDEVGEAEPSESHTPRQVSPRDRQKLTGSPSTLKRSSSTLSSKLREVTFQDHVPASSKTHDNDDNDDSHSESGYDKDHQMMSRGRDGGGSTSGFTSPINISDDEKADLNTKSKEDSKPPSSQMKSISHSHSHTQFQPRSLAAALRGELDDSDRVMADALGDQSDADVEELDLEMKTKEKERKEMAYILREERLDRIKQRADYE